VFVGWDDFSSLGLTDLKGLEEVKKYYSPPTSSLLVVKLISVERMDSAFLFLLLAVSSDFICLLSTLISSERKVKYFFTGPALASKRALFFSAV
jgi:hypothetical protein